MIRRGAAGVLGLVLAMVTTTLAAQVSPGPLARTHQALEGTLKCAQCHGASKNTMSARCLACHRDIGWLAERGRGLHGATGVKEKTCASCHPDHAGADFQLIRWPEGAAARFDHRRVGWPLEQTHGRLECAKCHQPAKRIGPAAALAPAGASRWTGLETRCASCHDDVHRGALGERCAACHDAGRWTAVPGFDHDTTSYPLTGRHAATGCDQCHLSARLPLRRDGEGRPVPIYQPVPHQTCASCHDDIHKGAFGRDCAGCHDTRGFSAIGSGKGFDHARTVFPLRGRHAAVRCAGCHRDFATAEGRKPPAGTCATCHRVDVHAGSATLAGKAVDCAACHAETGFSPGVMTVARHAETRYPLEGRHQALPCSECHRKDPSPKLPWGPVKVVIRPAADRCGACHADQHGGQLAARPERGDCAGCHRLTGWTPSSVDRAAHARTRLPLEGRHAEVACRACHGDIRPGLDAPRDTSTLGKARFRLAGLDSECASCHLDPHEGRYAASGARPVVGGCAGCHDTRGFAPAALDPGRHAALGFALGGAHLAVSCAACHRGMIRPGGATRTAALIRGERLRPVRTELTTDCAGCHREQSPHGRQFDARRDGGRCEACHGDAAFAPATGFDHDRDAAFKLEGRHAKVTCSACHRSEPVPGGAPRVVYRPLGSRCEDCHARRS